MSANILVIDDEPGIRGLCSEVLRRAGHEVQVADCGEAGIAASKGRRFDLVLEYGLLARIDLVTWTFTEASATPGPLPGRF